MNPPTKAELAHRERSDKVLGELQVIARELDRLERAKQKAYDRRMALWRRARKLNPALSWATIARASGVTEAAVAQGMKKAGFASDGSPLAPATEASST